MDTLIYSDIFREVLPIQSESYDDDMLDMSSCDPESSSCDLIAGSIERESNEWFPQRKMAVNKNTALWMKRFTFRKDLDPAIKSQDDKVL